MLTELLKSNMVKNDITSIKNIQKRLKERLDELVKENKFDCAQLPSIDKVARKKFGMLNIREEDYASCHQLGKHVIYLISIKLQQFVIWRVALEPWTSLVKDYTAPWKCCFPWWFLQIQPGEINLICFNSQVCLSNLLSRLIGRACPMCRLGVYKELLCTF